MARAEGTGNEAGAVDSESEYSGAADARLTELLRTGSTTAYPALRELRARHRESVLAYARLSTVSDAVARQLAAHAFTSAARETAQGADSGTPVRHRLLLLAAQVAGQWAAEERAVGLDPALRLVLGAAGPDGPVPPLLRAFHSLPPRTQGLIWYGLVERETEERTALLLGMSRADVAWGVERTLPALAGAALRTRLADSDDPHCQDFRRLIEESVRPDSPRHSLDLATHMTQCPHCTMAYEEQCALRDTPRAALAEGLLPWSGAAYAGEAPVGASGAAAAAGTSAGGDGRDTGTHSTGRRAAPGTGALAVHGGSGSGGWNGPGRSSAAHSRTASGAASGAGRGAAAISGPGAGVRPAGSGPAGSRPAGEGPAGRGSVEEAARAWPASRRFALASAALGVALTPLLLFLLTPGDPPAQNAAAHTRYTPPPVPAVTVTATVSVTPSPSPSPSPSKTRTSPSPKPTPTPSPTSARPRPTTAAPKPPPPPPAPHAPNGVYAEVVNEDTGRCLDIADGWFDKGNDVIAAPCSGSDTQLWRYDAERQVLQAYADDDFCLDNRGSDDRGAGIWTCDSVYGSNGRNLMFEVTSDGVIRPYVAPYTALTAYGSDDGLWFDWAEDDDGSPAQRWQAGRAR
ncbi:ricin-type beta-trefoil lectin domain protein [Streptomyces sp. NPDC058739]|uniref:RICIN domain-containing protein n=1 Tax=Streptomyces sp. NPDC058739 TaxID=3346618 RepID=UPI0036AC0080